MDNKTSYYQESKTCFNIKAETYLQREVCKEWKSPNELIKFKFLKTLS